MGLLLPAINQAARNFLYHRIIDVYIEEYVLIASSGSDDGPLTHINIRQTSNNELVLSQDLSGYSASVDISGLNSGSYTARVYTSVKNYTEVFIK